MCVYSFFAAFPTKREQTEGERARRARCWDLFAAKPTAHTTLHPVKSYSIWQSADADGDFLRYSADGKYHGRNDQLSGGGTPGPHVSGVAAVDGNRLVKVHGDTFEVRASG